MKKIYRLKLFRQYSFGGGLMGAAFLMATSAIGPGFITQTTVFTQQLFTSFGFVILISVLLDIVAQLNIWRVVAATGLRAPDLANKVFPGLGVLLVLLVSAGGLIFNIGNVGGSGLGLNILFGVSTQTGAMISCGIAVLLFLLKEFGNAMDWFAKLLGFVMICLTMYVAVKSHPPIAALVKHSFIPEKIDIHAIVTLVGGTVGGYISFAGAHRMLDTVVRKDDYIKPVTQAAVSGILVASIMRVLLFVAVAGVVAMGVSLSATNPAASVFEAAAGTVGLKIFGLILWAAAITSVVGAAYTSVSFLESLHPLIRRYKQRVIIAFILLSTGLFTFVGNPVHILVQAGAINGVILPLSLGIILIATQKRSLLGNYKHPLWLIITGWLVVALMSWMCVQMILKM
jgi:Mn2+/Fe2+ NRAMP family transporter